MTISRELIKQVRSLDTYDLRRLMMLIRGLLLEEQEATPAEGSSKVTFRQETVKCGKQGCTRCPHGPYWYAYWREGGKTRSRYVGKNLPGRPGTSPD
jgi:hypothetical protein